MTVGTTRVTNKKSSFESDANADIDAASYTVAGKKYQAIVACKSDGTALDGAIVPTTGTTTGTITASAEYVDRTISNGECFGAVQVTGLSGDLSIQASLDGTNFGYLAPYDSTGFRAVTDQFSSDGIYTFDIPPGTQTIRIYGESISSGTASIRIASSTAGIARGVRANLQNPLPVTVNSGSVDANCSGSVTVYGEITADVGLSLDMVGGQDRITNPTGRFVVLQITDTWTGTINFKAYVTNTVTDAFALGGTNLATGNIETSTTGNGVWRFDVAALPHLRITTAGGGTGAAILSFGYSST